MLPTVEGVFRNGAIELREDPPQVERAKVIVTFLPEEGTTTSTTSQPTEQTSNQRMIALLQSWNEEPLSAEEAQVLDDFEEFQKRHPLQLARPIDEP